MEHLTPQQQEERDTSREVTAAVLIVVALQATLAVLSQQNDWTLFHVHGWIWWVPIAPELVLLALLVATLSGTSDPDAGRRRVGIALLARLVAILSGTSDPDAGRRRVGIALLALVAMWNAVTVLLLILELFTGEARTGAELMVEATVVLTTLVLNFGLLYWELDGGGPPERAKKPGGGRDFLFSEMTADGSGLVPADWHPRLIDYTYLAFVTAIAWSAADTLPLTWQAKSLMALETAIAALTILLVAARAISVFG